MSVDESKQLYPNMMHLFRNTLLISPSTANDERGYSVINLLCSSLNHAIFDRLMRIYINGPESLSDLRCDYLLHQFKRKRDEKRIDF